jgi:hypothetical protein
MTCAASFVGNHRRRVQELYISDQRVSGETIFPQRLNLHTPLSLSPFNGYLAIHQLAKDCLSFEGIWSKFDRTA